MTEPTILMHRESAVAVLTLNRPQAGNTIDMALARDLEAQVDAALGDPTVRCIVLTGSGKLFCGGGDIGAIAAAGSDAGTFLYDLANAVHRSVKKLASGAKPVVTLINGPAAGAGLSLAIAGDVALASTSAHFSAAYGLVGLTPDGGMSWLLPRLVGLRRAQEIILTNCRVSAADAAAMPGDEGAPASETKTTGNCAHGGHSAPARSGWQAPPMAQHRAGRHALRKFHESAVPQPGPSH